MTALLTRDQQIELMLTVAQRDEERARVWLADTTVRSLFCKPAPEQPGRSVYRHTEVRVAVG